MYYLLAMFVQRHVTGTEMSPVSSILELRALFNLSPPPSRLTSKQGRPLNSKQFSRQARDQTYPRGRPVSHALANRPEVGLVAVVNPLANIS
ncbi:hypothetical protein J6590_093912 [Homalodisca vitripennis]|nr:hypothetical protein J6590_093912 [Homalodisca vitripennis]